MIERRPTPEQALDEILRMAGGAPIMSLQHKQNLVETMGRFMGIEGPELVAEGSIADRGDVSHLGGPSYTETVGTLYSEVGGADRYVQDPDDPDGSAMALSNLLDERRTLLTQAGGE